MTKKDYTAFAAALYATRPQRESRDMKQWQGDCEAICDVLNRDNPQFAPDKFLSACGIA